MESYQRLSAAIVAAERCGKRLQERLPIWEYRLGSREGPQLPNSMDLSLGLFHL